ncbi:hypothetical protein Ancab_023396, partial [Ancistrocladus abbreviatus]
AIHTRALIGLCAHSWSTDSFLGPTSFAPAPIGFDDKPLGHGCRIHYPSAHLKDYFCHTAWLSPCIGFLGT